MRLTKRQLKRIIREEKKKLQEFDQMVDIDDEVTLERVVINLKRQLVALDVGYSEEEANEAIIREVEEILMRTQI